MHRNEVELLGTNIIEVPAMMDDIFNSPTVVIRQRQNNDANRKGGGATPDRKAFSDVSTRPEEMSGS